MNTTPTPTHAPAALDRPPSTACARYLGADPDASWSYVSRTVMGIVENYARDDSAEMADAIAELADELRFLNALAEEWHALRRFADEAGDEWRKSAMVRPNTDDGIGRATGRADAYDRIEQLMDHAETRALRACGR